MTASLPYPAYELLKHEFAQFTWENSVEIDVRSEQRNRENLNFKSVASTIPPHRLFRFEMAILPSKTVVFEHQSL